MNNSENMEIKVEQNDGKYICCYKECKTLFSTEKAFRRHVKIVHLKVKNYACDFLECKYTSFTKTDMATHKKFHLNIKEFECHLCDNKFILKHHLEQHIKTHNKVYICDYPDCKEEFYINTELTEHKHIYHPNYLYCNDCEYKTIEKYNLNTHIKIKHAKIKDFKCPMEDCRYSCSTKGNLKNHVNNYHEKIKDYSCLFENCCFKSCNQRDINIHYKSVHLHIKDLECDECDYITSRKTSLDNHRLNNCRKGLKNMSGGEVRVAEILDNYDINYIFDRSYDNIKGCRYGYLRFDFRCLMANGIYFIEFDGEGHFRPRNKTLEAIYNFECGIKNDKIKDEYCIKNNIPLLRIHYKEKNIKEKILEFLDVLIITN